MIECQRRQLLLDGWCIGLSYGLFFSSVSRIECIGIMGDLGRCFLYVVFSFHINSLVPMAGVAMIYNF